MPEYKVVDFQGEICWTKLNDGSFVVDPEYLQEFETEVLQKHK